MTIAWVPFEFCSNCCKNPLFQNAFHFERIMINVVVTMFIINIVFESQPYLSQ
jgi:hypothetical protein